MKSDIEKIIEIGNSKIEKRGWKIYPRKIKYYGKFVRLFFQSKQLVETGLCTEDDDDMIYGIGIFLVNTETMEFHDVPNIESIDSYAKNLNS